MKRCLILGGSGFVGRALCEQLVALHGGGGPRIVVPTRRREHAKHLLVLPTVDVVEARIADDAALNQLLMGCDAVVNLVAILHGSADEFEQVHVGLPRRLAAACVRAGVRRLVHVSALGVPEDPADAPSDYLRTKSAGEQVLRSAGLDLTVLRPSVMFGEHDRFLNLFASMQAVLPLVPLVGAEARFQPVWVEDVARALVRCLVDSGTVGDLYECAGPRVCTLAELVRLAGQCSGHVRPIVPMPMVVGRIQSALLAWLPGEPMMSADNLKSMQVPNVASGQWPRLEALGITPTALETVAPTYLGQKSRQDHLNFWRAWARH
ncbi:MAG: complex I NDUFA9 subunit family protein [Burkholderiales bacterium]|nr:complex I NDUFA9 subunit family protein [Burkholderiales bacterium]